MDSDPENLPAALSKGVSLLKQNLEQLERFAKRELRGKKEIAGACAALLDAGAERVLVSLGSGGAVLTDGRSNLFTRSNNVAVNAKTGAGDAMLAAAALGLESGADCEEILRSGVAAGTASVATPGTGLFERPKYEEIYSALKVEAF